ncbi:unnamed protein product [Prorocentrum cordatum]|uniref:Uncharacterized protein n=1 Tax=Prorocentrum cordatum TaxID=2364126 RepID=A0ABN9SPW4_9DINO|nr:unnamed protein product [Polarella glacialis]
MGAMGHGLSSFGVGLGAERPRTLAAHPCGPLALLTMGPEGRAAPHRRRLGGAARPGRPILSGTASPVHRRCVGGAVRSSDAVRPGLLSGVSPYRGVFDEK